MHRPAGNTLKIRCNGRIPRPRAGGDLARPAVNSVAVNETIHDFGGFPRALHEVQYPAPGAPALADGVGELLAAAGLPCDIDR